MEYTKEEQRAAIQAIAKVWHREVERAKLQDLMEPPIFRLSTTRNWGRWEPHTRVLSIQARLAVRHRHHPDFLDTVRHEMAHQYVSEVVKTCNETPHGPTWRRAAKMFRADPKATAKDTLDEECAYATEKDSRVVRRIRKLLALSDSTEENEAELAAMRAQELMQRHHIESLSASEGKWDFRTLGKPRKRRPQWLQLISMILQNHYKVQCIWLPHTDLNVPDEKRAKVKKGGNRAFVLEVTGTPANCEIAEHVFDFLMAEGKRRSRGYKGTQRLDFLIGLYLGFDAKLKEQKEEYQKTEEYQGSKALVRQCDRELEEFWRRRYPRIKTSRASKRSTFNPNARNDGRKQGRALSVNPSVSNGNQGRALT